MAGAAGSASAFSDPAGDSGSAPDLTSVAVADDAAGTLTFTVTAPGFASVPFDHTVWLMVNTDMNTATGSGADRGTDYAVGSAADCQTAGASVLKWDGSTWTSAPEAATRRCTLSGDVLTLTLSTHELGIGDSFTFQVQSSMAGVNGVADYAPDTGSWTYLLARTAVPDKPAVGRARSVPAQPVAGKRFSATFPSPRSPRDSR